MHKKIHQFICIFALFGCSPNSSEQTEKDHSVNDFRISETQGKLFLNEKLDEYGEMSLEELVNQFGGGISYIVLELEEPPKYNYSITTVVTWEDEKQKSVRVFAFLTEFDVRLNASREIAKESVVLYR